MTTTPGTPPIMTIWDFSNRFSDQSHKHPVKRHTEPSCATIHHYNLKSTSSEQLTQV